jgi:hypothetical protein
MIAVNYFQLCHQNRNLRWYIISLIRKFKFKSLSWFALVLCVPLVTDGTSSRRIITVFNYSSVVPPEQGRMSHHLLNVQLYYILLDRTVPSHFPEAFTCVRDALAAERGWSPRSLISLRRWVSGEMDLITKGSRCTLPAAPSLSSDAERESDKLINQNNRVCWATKQTKAHFFPAAVFRIKKGGADKSLSLSSISDRYLAFPRATFYRFDWLLCFWCMMIVVSFCQWWGERRVCLYVYEKKKKRDADKYT